MSRRTKKREDGWYDINLVIDENVDEELKPLVVGEYVRHSLNKLGKIEDIEDTLGIDLTTLFKALENGFYYRNPWSTDKEIKHASISDIRSNWGLCVRNLTKTGWGFVLMSNRNTYFIPEDYGKTWALTREELL